MTGYRKGPVSRDITISEMLHMQGEGMSHKEIASACGCSIGTVYNYIGKKSKKGLIDIPQPKNEGAKAHTETLPASEKKNPVALPASKSSNLRLLRQERIELRGDGVAYSIDLANGTVEAKGPTLELVIGRDAIKRLILELQEIDQELTRVAVLP